MPSDSFHVHGVHDHAIEHAATHAGGVDTLPGRVAVLSAVLATLGALMTFQGGDTQANAQLYKNTASITKTRANDQWNYYQAKGIKHNLAEFGASMSTAPERVADFKAEAERYRKEQEEIKAKANALEDEVKEWDRKSEEQMHEHHRWALGATAMQIAIALSAIVLLSRKTWLLYGVALVGTGGLACGALALAGL
jgi:cytochrome c556